MAVNKFKPMPQLSAEQIELFWSRVDKRGPDECWPWTGGSYKWGYGQFSVYIDNKRCPFRSSRLAYFLTTGIDPGSLFACHSCDNPPCSNPRHIFPAPPKKNSEDMARKGRSASGDRNGMRLYPESVMRGDRNPWSKLTTEIVVEIRQRSAKGETGADLAREFGVNKSTACDVIKGRTWVHIPL